MEYQCLLISVIQVCSETQNPVEWIQEDNYMFRLSDFTSRLSDWFDQGGKPAELTANSLAPGRCGCNFKRTNFKLSVQNNGLWTCCEIAVRWMP